MLKATRCISNNMTDSGVRRIVHWNARFSPPPGPVRESDTFFPFWMECLTEKNGVSAAALLVREGPSMKAFGYLFDTPTRREIKSGAFNISVSGCPWRLTHFHCQAVHRGSCALTLEQGKD